MQKKSHFGFTLIELLLVVSIITTISAFSAVFFTRFISQNAVSNTQDRMIGQLRKAQFYAMMGKQNSSWGVNYQPNTITLFSGSSYAFRNNAFDETFSENPSILVSGPTEIVFAKTTGLPDITGTINITGQNTTKSITINSQGVANR